MEGSQDTASMAVGLGSRFPTYEAKERGEENIELINSPQVAAETSRAPFSRNTSLVPAVFATTSENTNKQKMQN